MEFINVEVSHIQHALRGMRNAMSGWDKSDTRVLAGGNVDVGPSDRDLARRLIKAGAPHRKFMRQISVIVDICKMPAYFMHEFATYKVGTTADSSSTMHKITSRPLTIDDFEAPETTIERVHLGVQVVDQVGDVPGLEGEGVGGERDGRLHFGVFAGRIDRRACRIRPLRSVPFPHSPRRETARTGAIRRHIADEVRRV